MTDKNQTAEDIPEVPEVPGGKAAQTVGTSQTVILHNEASGGVLGRDLAADLSGMAAASTDTPINRALVSSVNYVMGVQKEAMQRAEAVADKKEAECVNLRAAEKAALIEVASLKATLVGVREGSSLRAVINTLSGVVLGLTPFAYEKGGVWGALAVAVIGAALIRAAWSRNP
jgi:hypothetical protein